jgi:DNA-directed RNA polymerase specialized sigma24 family protein
MRQGIPEGAFDEEDAAIEAIYEFYEGMVQGKFPNISNRGELLGLLITITYRRVSWWRRQCDTQKRGGLVQILEEPKTKKQPTFATIAALGIEAKDEGIQGWFAGIPACVPDKKKLTPEEEAIFAEARQRMLEQLPDEELRNVATWLLDGGSTTEIADKLRCTDQTVRNKRDKIRDSLLVELMGVEPTPQRANEVVEKYQSLLNALDVDRRIIAESWLKGDKPQEIARKLGRTSTTIYKELLRIASIWENN